MATYSEPVDEDELLESLKDARSVLLVGCPVCANLSLAYLRDEPAYKIALSGIKAYAVEREASKLRRKIREKGIKANTFGFELLSSPSCIMTDIKKGLLKRASRGVDAVVTLCCIAGHTAIKNTLKDQKVVRGMRTLGTLSTSLKLRGFSVVVERDGTFVVEGRQLKE